MSINSSYQLHLKIMTPIHVGGQQEKNLLRGIDYIQHDGRLYLINKAKLFNPDAEIHPDELADVLALGDERQMARLLPKDKSKYLIPLLGTPGSTGEIKAFIKDGAYGKAYIPGSSIKGALRSAVAHYLCDGFAAKNPDDTFIKKFEESLFRLIKVGDIPIGETRLYTSKVLSLVRNMNGHNVSWKETKNRNTPKFSANGFDTSFESPPTGMVLNNFNLLIGNIFSDTFKNNNDFRLTEAAKKFILSADPIASLFKAINFATNNHLQRELRFFKKYEQGDKVRLIIKGIEALLNLIDLSDTPKTALLRFGSGSGFHSISGDWRFTDHIAENWPNSTWGTTENDRDYKIFGVNPRFLQGKLKFKSRRIAFNDNISEFYLMGFVLLSTQAFVSQQQQHVPETEIKTSDKEKVVEVKPVSEYKPLVVAAESLKNQAVVEAKVVGQEGKQMLVIPFITGYEQQVFKINYAGGLPPDTIIRAKVIFIKKSIKDGFNLSFSGIVKT